MVFRRREPRPLLSRLRGMLWPHIGWRRAFHYTRHRLRRLPGSPHSIAAGFASGAAMAVTPWLGLHFALAFGLTFLVRGNYIAAAVGALLGNPWTVPVFFAADYSLGKVLMHRPDLPALHLSGMSLDTLASDIGGFLLPSSVGTIPIALSIWMVCYFPLVRFIAMVQEARRHRLAKRRDERKMQASGNHQEFLLR